MNEEYNYLSQKEIEEEIYNSKDQLFPLNQFRKKYLKTTLYITLIICFLFSIFIIISIPLLEIIKILSNKLSDDHVQRSFQILENTPLLDVYNGLPLKISILKKIDPSFHYFRNYSSKHSGLIHSFVQTLDSNISNIVDGKIGSTFFIINSLCNQDENISPLEALYQIDIIKNDIVHSNNDVFELATDDYSIWSNFYNRKVSVFIGLEGGHFIKDSLSNLRIYRELGVKYMSLNKLFCKNYENTIENEKEGLTKFGVRVVNEMDRLGT
jgi:hypothetical protein